MQNRCHRQRQAAEPPAAPPPAPIVPLRAEEPPVRRWPHPIQPDLPQPDLHYVCCTLAYQNQLLADIKALLETIAQDTSENCK
ncbi:hypothetical protein KQI82_03330 [Oscillibacter sp. MSJ-2]|uniref:Uncharacterized protein n=1 Tax=Dysosmobacter acutus TaxID=2841504 RepID=A0ABS6F6S7_9FIRM|nr:hypothetical protein [Dysosmobacter acutus]MBU5625971.1 hypothetical protein [Dysosmobacter acutus]